MPLRTRTSNHWRRIASLAFLSTALVAQENPTLAVLDFDGIGLTDTEVATLTNRLRTNMNQLGTYRVIERGRMINTFSKQNFQMSGCLSDDCALEAGRLLGAQFVMSGSIGKVGRAWSIEMRVIQVDSAAVIKTASYATRGNAEIFLNEGLAAAARKISGVSISDSDPAIVGFTIRRGLIVAAVLPEEAEIYVDEIYRGKGKVTGLELDPGKHIITAQLDRHRTIRRTFLVEAGEVVKMNLMLRAINGFLAFEGPAGARVLIDGKAMAMTPTEELLLQVGTYSVVLQKPNYYAFKSLTEILDGRTTHIAYDLRPKPKAPAVMLSTVLPGGGQLYLGQRHGSALVLSSALVAFLSYRRHTIFLRHQRDYESRLLDYNAEIHVDIAHVQRQEVQRSFDKMKVAEGRRNFRLKLLGGIWAINLLDIVF
ncbi:MAG: PEGA domain-containing protein [Chloroflexi bacterium]|nr:PEGA domain-containing protein [Chloroflexota bacterium]